MFYTCLSVILFTGGVWGVGGGHVWGACMEGGMHGGGVRDRRDSHCSGAADGTHPTGMHFCVN